MSEADPKVRAAGAPAMAADAAVSSAPPETAGKRRPWRTLLMLSVPLLLALVGGYMWFTSGRYVSTDNAYVQRDMVSVAPEVSGKVSEVFVTENQRVRRGDLLFRIDPEPFRIALANANAQIRAAEVQFAQNSAQVAGTGADISGAEANLRFAEAEFARYEALIGRGFVTRTAFDQKRHDVEEARQRLANARSAATTAQSALATGGVADQPAVEAARVARAQALLNLSRTEVRAPSDGYVSQTERLQAGNAAVNGVPLVTVVRSNTTWIEANYKETQLTNMYVGQPAEVELDAYPGTTVHGHIVSIGAGTGAQFSLLPPQNATGNWVKVTQRVPVRIAVDGDPGRPLIAGLSADVTVDTRERPRTQTAQRH